MQLTKATEGDKKLLSFIKDREVRAIRGITSAGDGWRPAVGGRYLGRTCVSSEGEAIKQGKIFVSELKRKVEGTGVPSGNKPARLKRERKSKGVAK